MGLFSRTRRSPLPLGKAIATGRKKADAPFVPRRDAGGEARPIDPSRSSLAGGIVLPAGGERAGVTPSAPVGSDTRGSEFPGSDLPVPDHLAGGRGSLGAVALGHDSAPPVARAALRFADRLRSTPDGADQGQAAAALSPLEPLRVGVASDGDDASRSHVGLASPADDVGQRGDLGARRADAGARPEGKNLRDRLQNIVPTPEPPRPAPPTPLHERQAAARGGSVAPRAPTPPLVSPSVAPEQEPGSRPEAESHGGQGARPDQARRPTDGNGDRADGSRSRRKTSLFGHLSKLAAGFINVIATGALAATVYSGVASGAWPWPMLSGERTGPMAGAPATGSAGTGGRTVTTAALPPKVDGPHGDALRRTPAIQPSVVIPPPPPGLGPSLNPVPPLVEVSAPAALANAPTVPRPKPLQLETEHVALFDKLIAPARDTTVSVEDAARIRDAQTALTKGAYQEAQRLRDTATEPMIQKFIGWLILRAGIGTPRDMKAFLDSHPDWPEQRRIRQRMEEQLFIQGGAARDIKVIFEQSEPQTGVGVAALASAHLAEGNEALAREMVARAWRTLHIPANLETGFLERFGKFLTEADHKWRFDRLTIDDIRWPGARSERAAYARRMLPRLSDGERRKAEARLLVFLRQTSSDPGAALLPKPERATPKGAVTEKKIVTAKEKAAQEKERAAQAKLLLAERERLRKQNAAAIEKAFADKDKLDWGLAFHRIQWLRRNNRQEESWRLLLAAPIDADKVVSPGEWWPERRLAAYDALKAGRASLAYDLVKAPGPLPQSEEKDAAFLAGWIALRYLNDAKAAEPHFLRFEKSTDGPLSRGKAAYWLARTYNALGQPDKARAQLVKATANPDTFFGQLARMELDPSQTTLSISPPQRPTPEQAKAFNSHQSVLGAVIARRAGLDQSIVRSFLLHLRTVLEGESQQAMLAHLAEALDDTQFAVRIAKSAIARGKNLIYYGYPTHPMPAFKALRPPPEMAMLLGVARQESEFNVSTKSGAGAAGLMQVMAVTARHICRDYKLTCEIDRLGRDPAYNAMMASAYIGDRMDEFQGSYILTLAGYNAGPGRTRQWIREFGDPRDPNIDPVDWIHRIPFEETREYVFKVMSNIQIYRARLGEEATALRIRDDIRRITQPTGRRISTEPPPPDPSKSDEPDAAERPVAGE